MKRLILLFLLVAGSVFAQNPQLYSVKIPQIYTYSTGQPKWIDRYVNPSAQGVFGFDTDKVPVFWTLGDNLTVTNGVLNSTGGGGGAVDSVNGQTGEVVLTAEDVGAVGTADDNAFTGRNTFTLAPEVAWTAMTTGAGKTPALNTSYYITAFTADTTIDSYVGTPVNGSTITYLLRDCNGTALFNFPAAQRSGSATGTTTALLPTAGTHVVKFTYVNSAWIYQDDVVSWAHAITFSVDGGGAPLTTGVQIPVKTPYGGTIVGYTMMASPSGSLTFNVFRAADGAGLPTASIIDNAGGGSGSGTLPAISAGVEGKSTILTNWGSTTITAFDNLALNLTTVDGVTTKCTFVLYFQ
jgi:hypothetical protein